MEEEKINDCIFCKIAKKEIKVDILEENDNFIAFPDANPITGGHTLIIPKKHFLNILDLPSSLGTELLSIIKKVSEEKLKEGFEGFNIFMNNLPEAGQVVMHAHIHIIPRKKGDGIKFKL